MAKNNKKMWSKIGVWAFVIGLVIALLVALFNTGFGGWATALLAILGLIVGLLNVADEEVSLFLLAALVLLVVAGSLTNLFGVFGTGVSGFWTRFMSAIIAFVAPAAFVVSLTALYHIAKDR